MAIAKNDLLYLRAMRILASRKDHFSWMHKSAKWLDKLSCLHPYCNEFKTFEMYPVFDKEPLKSKTYIYNYFNKWHNTRTKIPSETSAEIDTLSNAEAVKAICYIVCNLIEQRIHFAIFYAEGQRSPHVRIYDFHELEDLDPYKREIIQQKFWQQIAGIYFSYLDKALWSDDHPMQIEFRPHWKYHSIFKLIFEYIPEVQHAKLNA